MDWIIPDPALPRPSCEPWLEGGIPLSLDGFGEQENPNLKWMMTGGTPILGNLP